MNFAKVRQPNDSLEHLEELLVWNYLVEPGDRVANTLRSEFGDRTSLRKVLRRDTSQTSELSSSELQAAYARWLPRYKPNIANDSLCLAEKYDMKLLIPVDSLWPSALINLGRFAPMLLWYRGNPEAFNLLNRSISVVGSRTCSSYGARVTVDVVSCAAQNRATVVSGGALGIDSVAHRTALRLSSPTVAVMAGSLDNLYPSAHWGMFEQIGNEGLLLSEMTPNSKPTRWRFLQRNRIIAALGSALVVTEAGWRSGSINTATHCNELGRRVFAIPGPITSPGSAGCNRLIRDNLAELLLDANDLETELGWTSPTTTESPPFGTLELRAFDFLSSKEQSVAQISASAGLSTSEVMLALGSLQLSNQAEQGAKGGWLRTK